MLLLSHMIPAAVFAGVSRIDFSIFPAEQNQLLTVRSLAITKTAIAIICRRRRTLRLRLRRSWKGRRGARQAPVRY
jgi:hypothetical protein